MPNNPKSSRVLRHLATATVLAVLVALGCPGVAHALTEQEIQKQCIANGGTYIDSSYYDSDGNLHRESSCCYRVWGFLRCELYIEGEYISTGNQEPTTGPTTMTTRPLPAPPSNPSLP
jgi:hypothetical protein